MTKDQFPIPRRPASPPAPPTPFIKCSCEVYDTLHAEIRRLKELHRMTNKAKKYERRRARNLERKLFNMSRGHESMRKERNRMKKNLEVAKAALERIVAWDDHTARERADMGSWAERNHYRGVAQGALETLKP